MIKWTRPRLTLWQSFGSLNHFFDACGVYYRDRFDDCLKQVWSVYLDLDLFQIVIDGTILLTLRGDNAISNMIDDSVHTVE